MAISSNDRVYTWAPNGKAFAGDSADLDRHRSPYNYAHGHSGRYKNPYDDITVQHLFDHTAGFARSGDGAAAARTFPYHLDANGQSQYEEIHKHFVATRAFLSKPGTRYSYSNHGMGMTTLLVEALTGKTYREYAMNSYLRPMGLKGKAGRRKRQQIFRTLFLMSAMEMAMTGCHSKPQPPVSPQAAGQHRRRAFLA